jgi:hypothetical protein
VLRWRTRSRVGRIRPQAFWNRGVRRSLRALACSDGAVEGASVLLANTQTDTDTDVKPLTTNIQAGAFSPLTLTFSR